MVLRRLRASLVVIGTWSMGFCGGGIVAGLCLVLLISLGVLPSPRNGQDGVLAIIVLSRAVRWAAIGALSGVLFTATVAIAERNGTVEGLSRSRFLRWGSITGAIGAAVMAVTVALLVLRDGDYPGAFWLIALDLGGLPLVGALLGRATAAATLRLARRDVTAAAG